MTDRLSSNIPDRMRDYFTEAELAVLLTRHEVFAVDADGYDYYITPTPLDGPRTDPPTDIYPPGIDPDYQCECGATFDHLDSVYDHMQTVTILRQTQMAVPESNPVTWARTTTTQTEDGLDTSLQVRESKPFISNGTPFHRHALQLVTEGDISPLAESTTPRVSIPADYDFCDRHGASEGHIYRTGVPIATESATWENPATTWEKVLDLDLLEAGLRALTDGDDYDHTDYVLYAPTPNTTPFVLVGPDHAVLLTPSRNPI